MLIMLFSKSECMCVCVCAYVYIYMDGWMNGKERKKKLNGLMHD